MVRKLLFHTVGVSVMMVVLTVAAFQYTKYHYQVEATKFWGDQYDPEQQHIHMDFPLASLMPHGGPSANGAYFGVCVDTPLPMIPVRVTDELDKLEALCGISEFRIESFVIEDEELKKMFAAEYRK